MIDKSRKIGDGGFAEVYKAFDLNTDTIIAAKKISRRKI